MLQCETQSFYPHAGMRKYFIALNYSHLPEIFPVSDVLLVALTRHPSVTEKVPRNKKVNLWRCVSV